MLQNGKHRDIGAMSGQKDGRGRGRDKGKRKPVKHREYISPEKWQKLSREERSAIFKKRETDKSNGKGYKKRPEKDKTDSRNQSSTNTAEDKSDAADDTEEDEHAGSAGRQFGKQVHIKKKTQ
jgi:hypothetical protein